MPDSDLKDGKAMLPIELDDGWYVVPTFRHLRLVEVDQRRSTQGLRYAAPEMMALANLLAHPSVGADRISLPLEGDRRPLRSAKDLGRALALAHLAGRDATESWPSIWEDAMRRKYIATEVRELGAHAGDGVRALLAEAAAFDDAHFSVDVGLLRGHRLTRAQLRIVAERLVNDALEPFEARARV